MIKIIQDLSFIKSILKRTKTYDTLWKSDTPWYTGSKNIDGISGYEEVECTIKYGTIIAKGTLKKGSSAYNGLVESIDGEGTSGTIFLFGNGLTFSGDTLTVNHLYKKTAEKSGTALSAAGTLTSGTGIIQVVGTELAHTQ